MLNLAFSGTAVLLGLAVLSLIVGGAVVWLRRSFHPDKGLGRRKDGSVVFEYAKPLRMFSLCLAIIAALLTVNLTQWDHRLEQFAFVGDLEEIIEMEVPITRRTPPPPPPPPPAVDPVPEEILKEEPPVFKSQELDPDTEIVPEPPTTAPKCFHCRSLPAMTQAAPPPPPLPPVAKAEVDKGPLITAERMPVFGTECRELSGEERKLCSDRELLRFVQSRINYPAMARENGLSGTVVLQFVVEKDGSVSNVEAARKVAGGCTEEAMRAIEAINTEQAYFEPGSQQGRKVRVRFTMPVKFQLE